MRSERTAFYLFPGERRSDHVVMELGAGEMRMERKQLHGGSGG